MNFCDAITQCYQNTDLCTRRKHQPDECYVVNMERGIERYLRGQMLHPMLEKHLDVFTTQDWEVVPYINYLKGCGR